MWKKPHDFLRQAVWNRSVEKHKSCLSVPLPSKYTAFHRHCQKSYNAQNDDSDGSPCGKLRFGLKDDLAALKSFQERIHHEDNSVAISKSIRDAILQTMNDIDNRHAVEDLL